MAQILSKAYLAKNLVQISLLPPNFAVDLSFFGDAKSGMNEKLKIVKVYSDENEFGIRK